MWKGISKSKYKVSVYYQNVFISLKCDKIVHISLYITKGKRVVHSQNIITKKYKYTATKKSSNHRERL